MVAGLHRASPSTALDKRIFIYHLQVQNIPLKIKTSLSGIKRSMHIRLISQAYTILLDLAPSSLLIKVMGLPGFIGPVPLPLLIRIISIINFFNHNLFSLKLSIFF
jgi:hypothetical protein